MTHALSFKKRFYPILLVGRKRQTIRRRKGIAPGDEIKLYSGGDEKIAQHITTVVCKDVKPVYIGTYRVYIEDREIAPRERERLATEDGFNSFAEMYDFILHQYGIPFEGEVITW